MRTLTKIEKSAINKAALSLSNQLAEKIALETKYLKSKDNTAEFNLKVIWNEVKQFFDFSVVSVTDPFV